MRIHYHQPYDSGKNIGCYYNSAMRTLGPSDWACFTDADAMFTTNDYGSQIERVVAANPTYGLFYAVTNRIGCSWQLADGVDRSSDDVRYHRDFGKALRAARGDEVQDISHWGWGGSGFFILVRKDAWEMAGGFGESGMLGVDWAFMQAARNARVRIGLIESLYLYHWYRGGDASDTSHLV